MSEPFERPRERLGSLAQSARSKHLKEARGILLAIGILTLLVNAALFAAAESLVQGAIDAELRKRGGGVVDPVKREQAIQTTRVLAGALSALGVLYIVFALIVHRYPVPVTVTALVIYVGVTIISAILNPEAFFQSTPALAIKVVIIVALVKAVQTAVVYQRERDAEAEAELEPDLNYE